MIKTSKEFMEWLGLKVGDRVACLDTIYIFKVIEHKGNVYLECVNAKLETQFIHYLLDVDFEILPAPKRVGDLKCEECDCDNCPIRVICINDSLGSEQDTLFETLEAYKKKDYLDQEIYDLLKARLDKEVEE